jgi:hypothetical protein
MTIGIPVFCFICFLALSSIAMFAPRRVAASVTRVEQVAPVKVAPLAWPGLLDVRAAGADVAVRSALARELATCSGRWALDVIAAALAEEPDAGVAALLAQARLAVRARAAQP